MTISVGGRRERDFCGMKSVSTTQQAHVMRLTTALVGTYNRGPLTPGRMSP
jgi:hypothetical protein